MKKRPANRSVIGVCKLLHSEGFTDFTANQIEHYWKHSSGLTDRQLAQIKRIERELSECCAGLSEGEKRVLGRFVGLHKKMGFDVGLRIGLTVAAVRAFDTDLNPLPFAGNMPPEEVEPYDRRKEQEQPNSRAQATSCKGARATSAAKDVASPETQAEAAEGETT